MSKLWIIINFIEHGWVPHRQPALKVSYDQALSVIDGGTEPGQCISEAERGETEKSWHGHAIF